MNIKHLPACLTAALFSVGAFAKLPPAPPPDPVAVAAKAEKDKAAAEKGKALQAVSEDNGITCASGNSCQRCGAREGCKTRHQMISPN